MRNRIVRISIIAVGMTLLLTAAAFAFGPREIEQTLPAPSVTDSPRMSPLDGSEERAIFAGGCFWGVEAVFEHLEGVMSAVSGYAGGTADTAEYSAVSSGKTGHAESVEVVFDPRQIRYETLLEVFFAVAHDPTQLNYQGPDHGTQYRSAIFYTSAEQRLAAGAYIDTLEKEKVFSLPVVTEVVPLEAFYAAESYHQDFMANNPNYPYIVYWDAPKIAHLESAYPQLLKQD